VDSLILFPSLKGMFPLVCAVQMCLLPAPPSQADCEELFSLLGLYQGMRATRVGVDNMESRLFIHRNYPLESFDPNNGKVAMHLENMVQREEIKIHYDLTKIEEYKKWVDDQQDLADAINDMALQDDVPDVLTA